MPHSHFLFLLSSRYCGRSSWSGLRHPPHRPAGSLRSPHQEERWRKLRPGQEAHLQESSYHRNLRMSIPTLTYLLSLFWTISSHSASARRAATNLSRTTKTAEGPHTNNSLWLDICIEVLKWLGGDSVCCQTARLKRCSCRFVLTLVAFSSCGHCSFYLTFIKHYKVQWSHSQVQGFDHQLFRKSTLWAVLQKGWSL